MTMENHATMLVSPDLKQSISASDTRMIIFSADSLRLMTTSEALRHDLNYSQAALNSMKVTDLLCDPDREKLRDIVSQIRTNRTNDFHLNTSLQRSDGSTFSVALKLSLMQLQNSPVIVATIEAPQRQAMTRVSEREARLEQIVAKVPSLLFQMRQGSTGLIQFSFLSDGCENLLGIPPESLYANARQLFTQIIDESKSHLKL
jgi:PAS domain S-box-containing protein